MSIQQSLNQALSLASFGMKLHEQSPAAIEKAKIKQENTADKAATLALQDYEATHEDLSPEELPAKGEKERERVEAAANKRYEIAQSRYYRDPSAENWEDMYTRGIEADEISKMGGTASYIEKLKKSVNLRTKELQDHANGFKERQEKIKLGGNQ